MSDLDADLYGDLYETDFAEQPQEEKSSAAAVDTKKPKPAEPAKKPPQTSIDTTQPHSHSTPAVQTPIAPQTQQIPTYEEPQTEYRDAPSPRIEGGYGGVERSVRPSEMKDEGKMFIGGLNWDTTDENLRNYFSQFGKVDACTIMRDPAGRSRCFAFLTFEDPASVNAVMVKEHYLDGKVIDPKRAIPRQEHQRATKLFIGGLAGSVTSESMREFFSQFGKVIDSTVMLDRETGRSKGFGFISFEDTDVSPFLGFGNLEIDGKLIDVKLAQPRYQRDGGFSEDAQPVGGGASFANSGSFNAAGATPASFNPAGGMAGAAGNAAFDPQALAALYTRMFQMAGGGMAGGGMNMASNMNPMMGGMGMPGGMRGGMGMGMGAGGMGMGAGGMGMGMGGPGMGGAGPGMGRGMNPNIPRGPRGAPTGPGGGVGPQRTAQRGHGYHPYGRS